MNYNGVLCVKYPPSQRPLHERPCMIVMLQLYEHEILFRAHDAWDTKALARLWRENKNAIPGLGYAAQWANTSASVSRANRLETSLGKRRNASTSKIFKVDILMS